MADRYILQEQKIPETKKTKDWDVQHVNAYLYCTRNSVTTQQRQDQIKAWKYYFCISDKQKQDANNVITKPYGFSLGLEYMDYPLIESKIEQMVGEYLTRPMQKNVYVINKHAKSRKLDEMFTMVSEEILREVNKDLEPALGFTPDTQNPDMQLPDNVEDFISSDYKTESEETANIILNQVLEIKNNKDRIKDLMVDFLVQDEAVAFIDKEDSHPCFKRVNAFECDFDYNPDKEIQDDPQYFIQEKFMPYNEIINTFDLTKDEEQILKSYSTLNVKNYYNRMVSYAGDGFDDRSTYDLWFEHSGDNIMQIRVIEMMWISKKQVRAKVYVRKSDGKKMYKLLPDDYPYRKKDDVETIWVDYKRKVLMAGPQLVLEHGPVPERFGKIDNPKKDTLPIVAIRRNNFLNSRIRSFATKLIQLQDFASETLFEIRLAMRRNQGRVLIYDAAQIPKQFLKTGGYHNALNRVMHHAKKDQFIIINSQDKASRYAFNQFTSLDLSTKGMLQELFNVLALIEDLASKFVGLPPEREGMVDRYATNQNTERAVAQSTARTEIYTSPFNSFMEAILNKVLMKAKYVYEENESVQYVYGDNKNKFFKVYPSFYQDDIGMSISNSFKENKNKANIDQAAQLLMANAQTPELILNLIQILNADTASESEKILKRGIEALDKIRQENMKAAQEAAQAEAEQKNVSQDKDNEVKRDGFKKDIQVAQINNAGAMNREIKKGQDQKTIKLAEFENQMMQKINSK